MAMIAGLGCGNAVSKNLRREEWSGGGRAIWGFNSFRAPLPTSQRSRRGPPFRERPTGYWKVRGQLGRPQTAAILAEERPKKQLRPCPIMGHWPTRASFILLLMVSSQPKARW